MCDWEELGCRRMADWIACGYAIYFDADICTPRLVVVDDDDGLYPPVAVLPAAGVPMVWERMIALMMTQLSEMRLGREGLRKRLRMYARVAAVVALALVLLDADGDGLPDFVRLLHLATR